jgi:hypothetical protein
MVAAVSFAVAWASIANADGEAGVVIQDGDVVTTYCIAFQGDGITGDQLLKAAGKTYDAFGGGTGLALCSIDSRGCEDASSFSSCFCQCQGGSCTYWAFFTRSYGKNWLYSALAFNLLKAKDGDVHGWKWGIGGPNNAPAPQDVTFDRICGHPPQGGPAVATIPPTATLKPTLAATAVSAATTGATEIPTIQTAASPSAGPSSPVAGGTIPGGGASTPLVTLTTMAAPASTTPNVADNAEDETEVKSSRSSLIGFGLIAGILLVAIAGAFVWRARNG